MLRIHRSIAILAAAFALCLLLPAVSQASGMWATQNPEFKGWGLVDARCFACPGVIVPTYQWNSNSGSWYSGTRQNGTQVYVHPYSGNWRWTWTPQRGWLVMSADLLVVSGYDYL